ncbi:hypothetical protein ASPBRDRAFT_345108 [Aspergillus brasiliensis CBS 101740]|uniref:BRCT domain-containing protein n=1 Tax=Aspergillus brasiliensis (strain CBS 101740 / IMI 381727 / IBT 21946) TaxID=767769 RepID=A0A1L9U7D3_ASPBC|nr:hypothetical protein ASPBRDRAFT_345108 [Aspergillus brasiliensis CBS 101740]
MPPPRYPYPTPMPAPTKHLTFDTWNSSSTGHQVADPGSSRGTTSWRETRREKLTRQFGVGRGDCTYDEKSMSMNGKKQQQQQQQQMDIRSMFGVSKPKPQPQSTSISSSLSKEFMISSSLKRNATLLSNDSDERKRIRMDYYDNGDNKTTETETDTESRRKNTTTISTTSTSLLNTKPIFSTLTIHINGQTTPTVSDHKLKQLLITHGANLSLHMHRGVTHVILGEPNAHANSSPSSSSGIKVAGAGGGLAAGKLQKEIQRGGWKGVKLVRVQWAIDSIAAGKRLSEAKYAVQLRTNQRSVLAFTASATSTSTSNTISSLS